jgi:hypothetical protein
VNPSLAVDNKSDLRLDSKALKALSGAVRHQLAAWQKVNEADVEDDAFADLQNDIAYLGILLHTLDTARYGVAPE